MQEGLEVHRATLLGGYACGNSQQISILFATPIEQSGFHRQLCKFSPIMEPQLVHQPGSIGLHGFHAQFQMYPSPNSVRFLFFIGCGIGPPVDNKLAQLDESLGH